ncbi:MAG: methyltransferase domain-containing protein [Pirellulales bacterium]
MAAYELDLPASDDCFDEAAYLLANPDVANAVRAGQLVSGRQHFDLYGRSESPPRRMRMSARIQDAKRAKQQRILPLIRDDVPAIVSDGMVDCLPAETRAKWNIVDTDAVSAHPYCDDSLRLVERHAAGLVLDVGSGKRPVYFDNVVNYEIVAYDTTDVVGVGEELPFTDNSFDAVISNAVLEHVKDPFRCAREIARVLKPGGDLVCAVPFLQPVHGYPHHYYNMTSQGMRNLFADLLDVERVDVPRHLLPMWSLTWICSSWAAGLTGSARDEFLALRIGDLVGPPVPHLHRRYVTELPATVNSELAAGHVLLARKPRQALAP